MSSEEKDFSNDLFLNLEDIEDEPQQTNTKPPRDIKEQHRAAKRIERGPVKNQSYSIPVSLIKELKEYVFTKKIAGEKISASQVVVEGIRMYLKNTP